MCGHTRAGVRSTQWSTGHGWVSASGHWPRYARNCATAMATAQCFKMSRPKFCGTGGARSWRVHTTPEWQRGQGPKCCGRWPMLSPEA
eukprot:1762796-Prymnesium_polylepis.1